jgi:hypothetical protein
MTMSRRGDQAERNASEQIKKLMANLDAADTKQIVNAIDTKMTLAMFASNKAHHHRLDAGRMLNVLRKRIEAEGHDWWKWHNDHFARSKRDAQKLLAMASADDPEAAAEKERDEARQRMAKSRGVANVRRSNVVPLVNRNEAAAKIRLIVEMIGELDDQGREELWAACRERWHGGIDADDADGRRVGRSP